MSSLLTKLSRLAPPGPSAAPNARATSTERAELREPAGDASPQKTAVLDDLRARMQAVLARAEKRAPRPEARLDAPELPFVTHETALGQLHVRTLRCSPAHAMGRVAVSPGRDAHADILALLALDPSLATCDPTRALYLDTETTGLSGGAGTVAFLVGLATWEPGPSGTWAFVVEQLLVRNLGEEAPMLARVAERVRGASMLVTFNGKAFDMPLLRARFVMARMEAPVEPPHLDLVHVARRLHKPRGVECKLTTLERTLLGFERVDDVPGGEVAACYLHFLRTGDTRAMLGVVDHNAWDVIAMAALVGLYGEPLDESQLGADDLAGVARTLRRAGALEQAHAVADRAAESSPSEHTLKARAEIAKARGDRARALADFEALATHVDCAKVRLELAKLYEHFSKDLASAQSVVERGTSEDSVRAARRRQRLATKIAKQEATLPMVSTTMTAAATGGRQDRS
jgi:uncharacterized protein